MGSRHESAMNQPIPTVRSPLTRRRFLGAATGTLIAPALLPPRRAAAADAGVVKVTAYDGFIPPDFKRTFTAEAGIDVQIRLADSQAPELNLLVAERPHPLSDLCTVTSNRLHQFVDAGVIEPLDLSRLKNWSRIDPLYSEAAWNLVNGQHVGVPLAVGVEVLVYNSEKITPAPDSWSAMFDPRYKGQTTYTIEDFLQCTMQYQGADGTFGSYVNNPDAAARAVAAARDLLIRNKGQVLKFYDDGSELQQMLLGDEVVLAQAYAGTLAKLILQGQPVRFVIPREGSLGFVYTFAIVKGAPNHDNAYRLLDAMLADAATGTAITRSAGYTSTFKGADVALTDREKAAFLLTPEQLGRIHFLSYEGQKLSSALIDRAVEEVKAA